jgi:hypothetical protein
MIIGAKKFFDDEHLNIPADEILKFENLSYLNELDSVQRFIDECCIIGKDEKELVLTNMEEDFKTFAADNLVLNAVGSNNSISESTIIIAFRRKFKDYRDENQVSDKEIRKIVRRYIGTKPSAIDYIYKGVELLNTPKSFKKMNEEAIAMSKLAEEQYRQQVQDEKIESTSSGSDFIR